MAHLRGPNGCPWDREQTHQSIALNLIEEAYETVDAIDQNDLPHLKEELGDLLLQVVFHAEMAAGDTQFDANGVIVDLTDKLISRHPHVFGEKTDATAGEVLANWETMKTEHKPRSTPDEGIPPGLPALVYAHKVLRRLAGAGQQDEGSLKAINKLAAELSADASEESIGKLLFEIAAIAKASGIDPEGALRREAKRRIQGIEGDTS